MYQCFVSLSLCFFLLAFLFFIFYYFTDMICSVTEMRSGLPDLPEKFYTNMAGFGICFFSPKVWPAGSGWCSDQQFDSFN